MSDLSMRRRAAVKLAAASFLLQGVPRAWAQAYPAKPVKLVLGFAAGGPLDSVSRLIAKELTEMMGQSFVVENRTGASGQLATEAVAHAAPDGYTLLSTASTFIVNPLLSERKQPDPLRDFVAVSHVAMLPTVLVVAKDFPANTLQELLQIARTRPLSYSSAGTGGPGHLAGALLAHTSKTSMTHVPFRGAAPALLEVMSGRIDFTFYTMTGLKEQVEGGKVKPIAITAASRHHLFPGVPTMTEGGVAGFDQVGAWFGLVAPVGTPASVVEQLNRAVGQVLKKASTLETLDGLGVMPVGGDANAFKNFLARDSARWSRLIKEAGIKAE